jgi:hypothetical protein
VYGNDVVCGKAEVYDNAEVYGNARVYDNDVVCGKAEVYDNAEEHNISNENNNLIKEKESMKEKIKELYGGVVNHINPYKKYIFMAALLIALDYFIFKGKFSKEIYSLGSRFFGALVKKLNSFIDKL